MHCSCELYKSYLAESVVILLRRRVVVSEHKAVAQGKVLNPQISERQPVLQKVSTAGIFFFASFSRSSRKHDSFVNLNLSKF